MLTPEHAIKGNELRASPYYLRAELVIERSIKYPAMSRESARPNMETALRLEII
jgi:hypothetical protein